MVQGKGQPQLPDNVNARTLREFNLAIRWFTLFLGIVFLDTQSCFNLNLILLLSVLHSPYSDPAKTYLTFFLLWTGTQSCPHSTWCSCLALELRHFSSETLLVVLVRKHWYSAIFVHDYHWILKCWKKSEDAFQKKIIIKINNYSHFIVNNLREKELSCCLKISRITKYEV